MVIVAGDVPPPLRMGVGIATTAVAAAANNPKK